MEINFKVDKKDQMDWQHGETKGNTQKAIKLFTKIFNENFDKKLEIDNYKVVDVSKKKNLFYCDFSKDTPAIIGTTDVLILPIDSVESSYSRHIRMAIEFKTTEAILNQNISSKNQAKTELLASYYSSFHPSITLLTDMNNYYYLYRIVNNNIEEYKASKEMAFKTVYWWLYEMCDADVKFNVEHSPNKFEKSVTNLMGYYNQKYKVKIQKEFEERLTEYLEVVELADEDLSPDEKFIQFKQFLNGLF